MVGNGFTTCLWFDGNALEAAEFYVSVFKGGKLGRVTRYTESGPGEPGSVLTVEFEINGQRFMGLNGGPMFQFSEAISFVIDCDDQAEVDHYWSVLSEGGLEQPCGWVKDKYGVSWQVTPTRLIELVTDPDTEKARRATDAMMKMSKIDLAEIEKAYAGA
ncbi:VOC family protein [Yinghuangia sp. ASG 101]|uniref:VOC family protein n=1 Tax=Yinghuangia sp. ASG 101 TaxID=2896848 RepID=UPI001E5A70AE|nr:VOC family protein [Yinghuangia sp. ASG 101]UGQ14659.1 VOC family protein [Yinghuangia sp. ASG 101]